MESRSCTCITWFLSIISLRDTGSYPTYALSTACIIWVAVKELKLSYHNGYIQ